MINHPCGDESGLINFYYNLWSSKFGSIQRSTILAAQRERTFELFPLHFGFLTFWTLCWILSSCCCCCWCCCDCCCRCGCRCGCRCRIPLTPLISNLNFCISVCLFVYLPQVATVDYFSLHFSNVSTTVAFCHLLPFIFHSLRPLYPIFFPLSSLHFYTCHFSLQSFF